MCSCPTCGGLLCPARKAYAALAAVSVVPAPLQAGRQRDTSAGRQAGKGGGLGEEDRTVPAPKSKKAGEVRAQVDRPGVPGQQQASGHRRGAW